MMQLKFRNTSALIFYVLGFASVQLCHFCCWCAIAERVPKASPPYLAL
jgi:hypothetical protein